MDDWKEEVKGILRGIGTGIGIMLILAAGLASLEWLVNNLK